ncbi:MAG: hypothetical protein NT028_09160 [candidate division Zixibacteria bacterium]|nr:hypothetical protein [candidate division Zixibacteria bacterium]
MEPANVTDSQALSEVGTDAGMVFADKGYSAAAARGYLVSRGCHEGVILKSNRKDKNRDKDRWLSAVRMPFEGVFARLNQRARYRGTIKNQFQALMPSFAHNLKRMIKIETGPIPLI